LGRVKVFKLIVDDDIPDKMPRKIDLFLLQSRGWGMSTLIVDVPDEMPLKIELELTSFCCRPDKEPRAGPVYANCGRP
jgi:hypothetical protein